MKIANFFVSVIAALLALGMVYGAAVTESHMKVFSVGVFTIIALLCIRLVVISYKELRGDI